MSRNPRRGPPEIIAGADPLVLNGGEARTLTGIPAVQWATGERAAAAGALVRALLAVTRRVVLTAGRQGAYIGERGAVTHVPGHRINVVDTTGAGGEFTGVLAARLARGEPLAATVAG